MAMRQVAGPSSTPPLVVSTRIVPRSSLGSGSTCHSLESRGETRPRSSGWSRITRSSSARDSIETAVPIRRISASWSMASGAMALSHSAATVSRRRMRNSSFSTASSNATLPTALRVADEKLGLPRHVSRFVLTIGATANQNGTALFEGVTVIFLAQFFGIDLSLGQQFLVMLVCILGGIGTAGVPSGSLPVVALICAMVGVPAEGIGLVLGVNHFLDMCRTTVNVTGDLAIATLVSQGEAHRPADPAPAANGIPGDRLA